MHHKCHISQKNQTSCKAYFTFLINVIAETMRNTKKPPYVPYVKGNWEKELMREAVHKVKTTSMNILSASKTYKIPYATLYNV